MSSHNVSSLWKERAEQAEALVGRLREDLSKARASMDAAANIIRGLEDDPAAVRVALAKLDFGRQEAKTALALADPLGARPAEGQRALAEFYDGQSALWHPFDPKHVAADWYCKFCIPRAAVERVRGPQA